jgi:hypothetical protein
MPENIEPGVICPSPRSWISLSDCMKYMADNDDDPLKDLDYFHLLANGYLGSTITINFIDYIKKNYKIFSAKDILNNWNRDIEEDFKKMEVPELGFYSNELIKYLTANPKMTPKQSKNLVAFVKAIPKESASGFWAKFTTDCRTVATKWYNETEDAKDYIYGFLCKTISMGAN